LVSTPGTCTVNSEVITITQPFGSSGTYTGGTALSFVINGGYNPMSVKPVGAFIITSYNVISSTQYLVDNATASGLFTPTAGTITANLSANSNSTITYASDVIYQLTFSPQHMIPENGKLIITIPTSDITIANTSLLTSTVFMTIDGGSALSCTSLTYTSGNLTIDDAFTTFAWIPGTTGYKITLQLYGLRNPRTLALTPSFHITTTDASGYTIDTVT